MNATPSLAQEAIAARAARQEPADRRQLAVQGQLLDPRAARSEPADRRSGVLQCRAAPRTTAATLEVVGPRAKRAVRLAPATAMTHVTRVSPVPHISVSTWVVAVQPQLAEIQVLGAARVLLAIQRNQRLQL